MEREKIIRAGRNGAYSYLAVVCAYWWADNFSAHHLNWVITALFCICIAAMLARKQWVDKYVGYYLALASCYMLLAVGSAALRNSGPGHTGNFALVIAFGCMVFLLTLCSSIALILFASITESQQV